jgi:hypothetical protein
MERGFGVNYIGKIVLFETVKIGRAIEIHVRI